MRINRGTVSAGVLAVAALASSVTVAAVSHSSIVHLENQSQSQLAEIHSQHWQIQALTSQLTGSNPDVITCSDLQNLLNNLTLQVNVSDAIGDSMTGAAWDSSIQLPEHCINQ